MTKREQRVINAFINCVRTDEYSLDYAILLIEDNARYGWLSDAAKEVFYEAVEPEPEEVDQLRSDVDEIIGGADGQQPDEA